MSEVVPREASGSRVNGGDIGMSPYATGGGGVTFERKVAVQYLAHLLVGDEAVGFMDGRRVVSVAFQQAPEHAVDDLVVNASYPNEATESLVLALAVRRKPKIVKSDISTQKLFLAFVRAVINAPTDGPKHQLGLAVAGPQTHAEQLAELAGHAVVQRDAPGFFDLMHAPNKIPGKIRDRLKHLKDLVEISLHNLGNAEATEDEVQQHTWELLKCLTVSMPRLESPDETDWLAVTNRLIPVARDNDSEGALRLRDRLVYLANEYAPKAARVDLDLLQHDAHRLLKLPARRNEQGWQALDRLRRRALGMVCSEIISPDGIRRMQLNRDEVMAKLVAMVESAKAVVVSGESGVGKSALALLGFAKAAELAQDKMQVSCINLRHVPKLPIEFQNILGCPLSILLSELSAPQRILIIDGSDAVTEDRENAFHDLVDAAQESNVKVVAVTAIDSKEVVKDILERHFGGHDHVKEHVVLPLTDPEIDLIVEKFAELQRLNSSVRSRELLRRLVVVDLLVRSGVRDVPLSDADAMHEIWSGLVRKREMSDKGMPGARETVLLKLADLELREVKSTERIDTINGLDLIALDGLRQDGLLRNSRSDPFAIGPEFAHDEVRRYAVARLLLVDRTPAEKIRLAECPRWSLAAARLACQTVLAEPCNAHNPLKGRLSRLQSSFDSLVESGYSARWGDVPGEALITTAYPGLVLQDAWTDLRDNYAAGVRRLARLVDQRLRDNNGIVDINAVEPIIELLLGDQMPLALGEYAQELLRDWLRAHVIVNTAKGYPLRVRLREHLMDVCKAADFRFAKETEAKEIALAAQTPRKVERDNKIEQEHMQNLLASGQGDQRQRPEIPPRITSDIILELLALLGPDLSSEGEAVLRRAAEDAPWCLAPALEEVFTGHALASYGKGLLARLTEAFYLVFARKYLFSRNKGRHFYGF